MVPRLHGGMIMSNGINQRQNEDKSLMMLAAQRQLYSEAKGCENVMVALSVFIPFVLSFVLLFVSGDSPVGIVTYVVSIISAIVSFFLEGIVRKRKGLAAAIQQKFDVYVYSMPWDSRLFGKEKALNNEIADYSNRIMNDHEKKTALYDWYTSVADERPLLEGILMCQRENVWWDVGLRKKFKIASIIGIIILCACIFVLGILQNESVGRLLWRFAFVVPMIKWLLDMIKQINEDIDDLNELDSCVRETHSWTMEELQDIQRLVYEHRKKCFTIPNIFYAMFRENDEDKAHRAASMDI